MSSTSRGFTPTIRILSIIFLLYIFPSSIAVNVVQQQLQLQNNSQISTITDTIYPIVLSAIGNTFYGVGAQSTAGTARLLIDYPIEQRNEILDLLFKPQYGASLQHLKVEIGGDAQISCGAEASGMHTANESDIDWNVGYEGWLMAEAKQRNPSLSILGLVYAWPKWINPNGTTPYASSITENNAANYVVNWVKGMRDIYNVNVDWVGIWNEREYTISYILTLRKTLDIAGFSNVQIIASDRAWEPIATDYYTNSSLRNAVNAITQHYPNCDAAGNGNQCVTMNTKLDSFNYHIPLYSSEDYSCWTDSNAAVHWVSKLNNNYLGGNITFFSIWYLVTAFYPSVAFWNDGILRASQPWSGNYEITPTVWATAHYTQFTKPGWTYLLQGQGSGVLTGGGTYVSLVDSLGNITIIIEAAGVDNLVGWSSSNCNAVQGLNYIPATAVQNATFQFQSGFTNSDIPQTLSLWRSRFFRGNRSEGTFFEQLPDISIIAGEFTLLIEPDTVYTLSTYSGATNSTPTNIPISSPFPLPYTDDFESLPLGSNGKYWTDMMGSFQIRETDTGQKVLRQVVEEVPCCNFIQSLGGPVTLSILGSSTWRDVEVTIDITIPSTGFAYIGVRSLFGTAFFNMALVYPAGVFLVLNATEWRLVLETVSLCGAGSNCPSTWSPCIPPLCVLQGVLPTTHVSTVQVTLGVQDSNVWGKINGFSLPGMNNFTLPNNSYAYSGVGFIGIGGTFVTIDYDNLSIISITNNEDNGLQVSYPVEGSILRGLPCGDPATQKGALWSILPGEGTVTNIRLRSNNSLCLAPTLNLTLATLIACDSSDTTFQQWSIFTNNASIVHYSTGYCLSAVSGAFVGNVVPINLEPCMNRPMEVWWSSDTGYIHTSAQNPLQMVCFGVN